MMLVFPQTRMVIEALTQGAIIRTAVSWALRAAAVVTALVGLYLVVEILKAAFQLPGMGTIGGLLFAIVFAGAIFAIVQILLYRADTVAGLGDSQFTVIPIFSLLCRAAGECYAATVASIAVGGCIFTWLSGAGPSMLLPGVGGLVPGGGGGGGSFVEGLVLLVLGSIAAFFALVAFYFVAEMILVVADIARNVRLLVTGAGSGSGSGQTA
jgi:hypothetical protein